LPSSANQPSRPNQGFVLSFFPTSSSRGVQLVPDFATGLDRFGVWSVRDIDKADLVILFVIDAARRRFVLVLKPVAADELRMAQGPKHIILVSLGARVLAFHRD